MSVAWSAACAMVDRAPSGHPSRYACDAVSRGWHRYHGIVFSHGFTFQTFMTTDYWKTHADSPCTRQRHGTTLSVPCAYVSPLEPSSRVRECQWLKTMQLVFDSSSYNHFMPSRIPLHSTILYRTTPSSVRPLFRFPGSPMQLVYR